MIIKYWYSKTSHVESRISSHRSSHIYRNDPKFLDRYAWANSADLGQTAPRGGAVWSGSTQFAVSSASFELITLWYSLIVQMLEWLQQIVWVSKYLGNLR